MTIAMDGPAASGKTTVGQMLAETLGYVMLDTGCMYRAVTLAALQGGVDVDDEAAVVGLARTIKMDILSPEGFDDGRVYTLLLDGIDVTWLLRSPAVDGNVSRVSSYREVREEMVRQQRVIGAQGGVVMIGRDIGTVVLPDAPLKLYVIASAEERAKRRLLDRQAQGNTADDYEAILADIKRRDHIDSTREHSPLTAAADAITIDTSGRPPQDVLAEMMKWVAEKGTN